MHRHSTEPPPSRCSDSKSTVTFQGPPHIVSAAEDETGRVTVHWRLQVFWTEPNMSLLFRFLFPATTSFSFYPFPAKNARKLQNVGAFIIHRFLPPPPRLHFSLLLCTANYVFPSLSHKTSLRNSSSSFVLGRYHVRNSAETHWLRFLVLLLRPLLKTLKVYLKMRHGGFISILRNLFMHNHSVNVSYIACAVGYFRVVGSAWEVHKYMYSTNCLTFVEPSVCRVQ